MRRSPQHRGRGRTRTNVRVNHRARPGSEPGPQRTPTVSVRLPRTRVLERRRLPPWIGRIGRLATKVGIVLTVAWAGLLGVREVHDYATTSARFEVRGLLFEPSTHVSEQRVRELLGIQPGTNILSIEPDALAQRLLGDPWVASAKVERVLPDSLRVQVVEHRAKAVLVADELYLVTAMGLPFKRFDAEPRGQLPLVTGVSRGDLLRHPVEARERIRLALSVIDAYQQKDRPRVGEVHVDETSAVTLYTAERGTQIRLGRGVASERLARYDALRAALGTRADDLAIVHLDATLRPDGRERVVASFFSALPQTMLADAGLQRLPRADLEHAQRTDPLSPRSEG